MATIETPDLLDNFPKHIAKLGVCAFSLKSDETLLWSHYADNHRGVCICYEFPAEFINAENKFLGIAKVNYGSKALDRTLASCSLERDPFLKELLKTYLTTKSPTWSYEKEARAIRNGPGKIKISGDYIKQICFGIRTSKDDVALIKNIANTYTSCRKFTKMVRNNTDFGFEMQEFSL